MKKNENDIILLLNAIYYKKWTLLKSIILECSHLCF